MAEHKVKKPKTGEQAAEKKHKRKKNIDAADVADVALFAGAKKRKKDPEADGSAKSDKKKQKIEQVPPVASDQTSTASDDTTLEEEAAASDPLAVGNFNLSAPVKARLATKGILALFPIQAQTLDLCLAGMDLVGRARWALQ